MNIDKKILQQYIEGSISDSEVEKVVMWLDESAEHVEEFMVLHKLYQISVVNRPSLDSVIHEKKKPVRIKSLFYGVLRIAALALILLGISSLIDRFKKNSEDVLYQTLYVPAGQRVELTLPDATKVWVNAQSRITYPLTFGEGERIIKLEGEAFFDITQDKKRPFIVKTQQIDVQVIGTEFNLMAYSRTSFAEVSLLEGEVRLISSDNQKQIIMNPNEHVRYEAGKFNKSLIEDYNYFRWKEGLICFNNESVYKIMEKLELHYDVKITVKNQNLLQQYYSGKFRTKDGVEQVLKVLQIEHKFNYVVDKEENLITIK